MALNVNNLYFKVQLFQLELQFEHPKSCVFLHRVVSQEKAVIPLIFCRDKFEIEAPFGGGEFNSPHKKQHFGK